MQELGEFRIIPAYAGSTASEAVDSILSSDHPRLRGEHSAVRIHIGRECGSSPPTRGAPRTPRSHNRRGRIIPAYAGSTRTTLWDIWRLPDHPRLRGEHEQGRKTSRALYGSSPPTRGARVVLLSVA